MHNVRRSTLRQEFLNLPNILTFARIVLIAPLIIFLGRGSPRESFIASVIVALAAITDSMDGYLARKFNLISVLGKFMDPLADKLLVMSASIVLVELDRIPSWLVVLILSREFAITGLRALASTEGLVIAASEEGRLKTAFQLVGVLCLIIHYDYTIDYVVVTATIDFHVVGLWLIYLSLFFSLFSAFGYFRRFVRAVVDKERTL